MRELINLMESAYHLSDKGQEYWNSKGPHQAEWDKLFPQLVPGSGKSDTLAGEVMRCAARIYYRHYNDGDEFTPESFSFLRSNIGSFSSYDEMVDKAAVFAMNPDNRSPNSFDSVAALKFADEHDDERWDDEDEY